jgi:hypothetical protein
MASTAPSLLILTACLLGAYELKGLRFRSRRRSNADAGKATSISSDSHVKAEGLHLGRPEEENVVVQSRLAGGSDARTEIINSSGALVIRKSASGPAANKLQRQAEWLELHASDLPLTKVIKRRSLKNLYYYDMPYNPEAENYYDRIHKQTIPESLMVLRDIFERVYYLHDRRRINRNPSESIERYLQDKVISNALAVIAFARALVGGDEYFINGERFSLTEWECLLDTGWLRAQIRSDDVSIIHGDLTIENVIVKGCGAKDWFLIDPNPDNIFNSPLIDWAKLMQSLNLGYEALNRSGDASVVGNRITLTFFQSFAYTEMHRFLIGLLRQRFNEDQIREIYFHEIVNYLRLIPYKLRHSPQKAIIFFGCTAVLLRRYIGAQRQLEIGANGKRYAAG